MRRGRAAVRWAVTPLMLGLLPGIIRAQFTKTITVTPNVTVNAITTWYFANCTTILGVGSYSVDIAPQHGTLSFSGVSGPIPGCPAGSPSLPAVAAFYTWTDTTSGATSDCFQLTYQVDGQSQVDDISVVLMGAPSPPSSASCAASPPPPSPVVITTTSLPDTVSGNAYSATLTASGGKGPITWASSTLPIGFTLSNSGILSTSGTPAATPGHVNLTVTATDGVTTATKTLTLAIAPADCTKLFVVNPQNLGADVVGKITVTRDRNDPTVLRFNTDIQNYWFGYNLGQDGISINIGTALTRNSAVPLPVGEVYFAYVQNLTAWPSTGHATYGEGEQERAAALIGNASLPLLDVLPTSTPPYYTPPKPITTPPRLGDSPDVVAPISDNNQKPLTHISYVKNFTTYLGCYNEYDRSFYSDTNPQLSVFHILGAVDWHANYSGTVVTTKGLFGGYVFEDFIPDEPENNGTKVDRKYVPGTQPKITPPLANGSTTYQ